MSRIVAVEVQHIFDEPVVDFFIFINLFTLVSWQLSS